MTIEYERDINRLVAERKRLRALAWELAKSGHDYALSAGSHVDVRGCRFENCPSETCVMLRALLTASAEELREEGDVN